MAKAVDAALASSHHVAIEVAPGTGRTLAYLVPAIRHADSGPARVAICVAPRSLRRQILDHDAPLLRSIMPQEFSCVELQERHRYIGLRRLDMTRRRQTILINDTQEREQLWHLRKWVTRSADGVIDELHPGPELALWNQVYSAHGNCLGFRCPHHNACFYHRARRRALHSQLLVIDHGLLLSDLAMRRRGGSLLPDFDAIIVDQAHVLAAQAPEHFGLRSSRRQLRLLLRSLFDPATGCGLLGACHAERAVEVVHDAIQQVELTFASLTAGFAGTTTRVITSPPRVHNTLSPAMRRLAERLSALRDQVTDEDDLFELTYYIERCTTGADTMEELLDPDDEGWHYTVRQDESGLTELSAAPLNMASELHDTLFGTAAAVVLTGPALGTGQGDDRLSYARDHLGLGQGVTVRLTGAAPTTIRIDANANDRSADERIARDLNQDSRGSSVVMVDTAASAQDLAERLRNRLGESRPILTVHSAGTPDALGEALEHHADALAVVDFDFADHLHRSRHRLTQVWIAQMPAGANGQDTACIVRLRRGVAALSRCCAGRELTILDSSWSPSDAALTLESVLQPAVLVPADPMAVPEE
jgi:ATP-dependent DNA helicase DinG